MGTLCACAGEPEIPANAAPLEVEFANCAKVIAPGPLCTVGKERRLTLWVPSLPNTRIEVHAGSQHLTETDGVPFRDGLRFSVPLPSFARRVLVIRSRRSGRASSIVETAAWSLALAEDRTRTLRKGERDIQAEIHLGTLGTRDGDGKGTFDQIRRFELASARSILNDLEALSQFAPLAAESRYLLAYNRGLLADQSGNLPFALDQIDDAIEVAERGDLSGNLDDARHERALLLANLGRSVEATTIFSQLAQKGLRNICKDALLWSNWAWQILLAREAAGVREPIGAKPDPIVLLNYAFMWNRRGKCLENLEPLVWLNQAHAYLQEDRFDRAAQALAEVHLESTQSEFDLDLWQLDLSAQVDLGRGLPRNALAKYQRLRRLALAKGSWDGELRAHFGAARAFGALGIRTEALKKLTAANALLDRLSRGIPLQTGRETLIAQRNGVARLEVELLLDQGRIFDALVAARRGRSRALVPLVVGEQVARLSNEERALRDQAIERYQTRKREIAKETSRLSELLSGERTAYEVRLTGASRENERDLEAALGTTQPHATSPATKLPPPRAGELLFAFHPLPRGEWVVFASDSRGITVRRFPLTAALLADREALAREILEPFRKTIRRAARIRFLPLGPFSTIDFHALPFEGDVLLASKPVVYGLDLATQRTTPQNDSSTALAALLVANPSGDLPGSLSEIKEVERALKNGSRSFHIDIQTARYASTQTIRERLETASLFHYSGHGRAAGLSGWDSRLLLSDGQLSVGDLLTLPRLPRWVVLSGCDTGRTTEAGPSTGVGLGLAQAFALAGSQAIVASMREVDDRDTVPFVVDLYRRWDREPDLAIALQQAQLAWREKSPRSDWANFRLIEP